MSIRQNKINFEMTLEEVAQELGCTRQAVYQAEQRGLKKLAIALERYSSHIPKGGNGGDFPGYIVDEREAG